MEPVVMVGPVEAPVMAAMAHTPPPARERSAVRAATVAIPVSVGWRAGGTGSVTGAHGTEG
ncbi:hypothetical protein MMRN_27350 [Mycobacterium marinum]|nr:hypothetical protein MMRN_27350 [Mycobacterium marinum]